MSSYLDRPLDIQQIYNPAFTALLMRRFVAGSSAEGRSSVSPATLLLGVAVSLSFATRAALTNTVASRLVGWAERNAESLSTFPPFLISIRTLLMDGALVGLRQEVLNLAENGLISAGSRNIPQQITGSTSEVIEIQKSARYLGRWFAAYDDSDVLRSFGARA